jgi:hypothetical protein
MKKLWYILITPFILAGCEDIDFDNMFGDILDEITGNASMVAYNNNSNDTVYAETFNASTIMYTADTTSEGEISDYLANIAANTNIDSGEVTFPYMFFSLDDTIEGNYYSINCPIDLAFILDFNLDNFIGNRSNNLLVIALSETNWIIASNGSINLTNYEGYGGLIEGNFSDVIAFELNQEIINEIIEDANNNDLVSALEKIESIPCLRLDGNFESRHLNINSFLNSK